MPGWERKVRKRLYKQLRLHCGVYIIGSCSRNGVFENQISDYKPQKQRRAHHNASFAGLFYYYEKQRRSNPKNALIAEKGYYRHDPIEKRAGKGIVNKIKYAYFKIIHLFYPPCSAYQAPYMYRRRGGGKHIYQIYPDIFRPFGSARL